MKRSLIITIALIAALAVPICASSSWARGLGVLGMCGGASGGACSTTPYITQDVYDSGTPIGQSTIAYSLGLQNTGSADLKMCAIELYVRENGSLAGKTLYVERWSTASYSLSSKLQDVTSISASDLPAVIGYHKITFPEEITLSAGQALVFTMNEVTGATDYITVASKGGGSVIDDQALIIYNSSGTGTYSSGNSDFRAKIYKVE